MHYNHSCVNMYCCYIVLLNLVILIICECVLLLVGSGVDIYVFAEGINLDHDEFEGREHLMEDMDNLKTVVNCMEHMWQVWQQEDLLEWQPKPMSTGMYTSILIFMPKKLNAVK